MNLLILFCAVSEAGRTDLLALAPTLDELLLQCGDLAEDKRRVFHCVIRRKSYCPPEIRWRACE